MVISLDSVCLREAQDIFLEKMYVIDSLTKTKCIEYIELISYAKTDIKFSLKVN